jgi:hypothetical protein
MLRTLVLLLLAPVLSVSAAANAPAWALHDTEHLTGNIYAAVCSGSGPSIGFARQEAIDSCRTSAALHLPSEITIKSMSVTSETQGAFQQEVRNHARVSGLVCAPKREEIEETETGVRLWILCQFDLSRARIGGKNQPGTNDNDPESDDPSVWVRERAGRDLAQTGAYWVDKRKVMTFATIPMCTDLIVRGAAPARVIRCNQNPISIILEPSDREVIVRASGYFARSVSFGSGRISSSYEKVVLEPSS